MAITRRDRLDPVTNAAHRLTHVVQGKNEVVAELLHDYFDGKKHDTYHAMYKKLHEAVSATCEALDREDLTANIPVEVTGAATEEYWIETKLLIKFVEANFPEGKPVAEPKAASENPPPVGLSDDEKRYQLCRRIVRMLRRLNRMVDPSTVSLEISIGIFTAQTIKEAQNLLLDSGQLNTPQLTELAEQVRKKVEEYAPRPDQQLVTRFLHLRNWFTALADGKEQLKDAVPTEVWEITDATEARRTTTSHQLTNWCKIMQQKKKELQTVPVSANKETIKKDEPVVVVDPKKLQKAAAANATFQPPAADLAAGNGEEFKQEPAEIEVIPQEPTTKELETTNIKENEVSKEKSGETPNDKDSQPAPEPIQQRQQFAVLSKQRILILLDAKHLLVTDWLVTAEDIKFFGKVFRTIEDVKDRIALLDEAIAENQEKPTPKTDDSAAKATTKPDGLVTEATWLRYLTLRDEVLKINADHDSKNWKASEKSTEEEVQAWCIRLQAFITAKEDAEKAQKTEKKVEHPPTTREGRDNLILGGALTVFVLAMFFLAYLWGASSSNDEDTTNQKPQISSELQEILDSIEE